MAEFKTSQAYSPMADQPQAIAELSEGIDAGDRFQTLLGATGTGKSIGINSIITSLIYQYQHKEELRFLMIDPKFVEESLKLFGERRFPLRVKVPASEAATSLRRSLDYR